MTVKRLATAAALVLAVAFAACSGGGGSKQTPGTQNNQTTPSSKTVMVHMTFSIYVGGGTSAYSRRPQFTSTGINGGVASELTQNSNHPPSGSSDGDPYNVVQQSTALDLKDGDGNCSTTNGVKTCHIIFPAEASPNCGGVDANCEKFELDTYAEAPGTTPCGPGTSADATPCNSATFLTLLSSGVSGPTNIVAGGPNTITVPIQAIITSFHLPTGAPVAYSVGLTATSNPGGGAIPNATPSNGAGRTGPLRTTKAWVQAALANGQSQSLTDLQITDLTVRDGASINIGGGNCGLSDQFANVLRISGASTSTGTFYEGFAPVNSGTGHATYTIQPCGTSGFLAPSAVTAGSNLLFPADQLKGTYDGGGGPGNEDGNFFGTTPPYFAYIAGSTYLLNNNAWPGTHAAPGTSACGGGGVGAGPANTCYSASNRGFQFQTESSVPVTGDTVAQANFNYVLAPLFAIAFDFNGTRRNGLQTSPPTVTVNLAGPGTTGRVIAAQITRPSGSTGYTLTSPGDGTGCQTGTSVVAAIATMSGALWGQEWRLTAGSKAASGTQCTFTMGDGVNTIRVFVTNTVATGP